MHFNAIDRTGQMHNGITFIRPTDTAKVWQARCHCGNVFMVIASNVMSGNTRSCGCLSHRNAYKGNNVTYSGAHMRVRSERGGARGRQCVDCAGQATEWSYNHGCVDEQTGESGGLTVPYCSHPEHYSPRCVPCHRIFDGRLETA